jgi:hypothetical protein
MVVTLWPWIVSISGSGSGKFDMLLYVSDQLFQAVVDANSFGENPYVYLFSSSGADLVSNPLYGTGYSNSDGFEEFAFSKEGGVPGGPGTIVPPDEPPNPVVPEPSSLILMGTAMFGMLVFGGLRRKKRV